MARHAEASAHTSGICYGAWGFPLAFLALPLYVQLPAHYAQQFGVSLTAMGALLLAARGLDAVIDPWLGRRVDGWMLRSTPTLRRAMGWAAVVMSFGFAGLFLPSPDGKGDAHWLAWCGATLLPTMLAYSLASIAHQSWGARLGGPPVGQARIVAWREACGLLGVLCASALPALLGWPAMVAMLAVALAASWWLLRLAPEPIAPVASPIKAAGDGSTTHSPWRHRAFRRLVTVFALNGIASAIPATLVLFFVQDRLQAATWSPAFLGSYFLAAAVGLPVWVRCVPRWGLARTWSLGMALSIASFAFAWQLGPGDSLAFLIMCLTSGLALGADLALPSALLATILPSQTAAGAAFGWWNCVAKLNLALAAGLSLPLLAWGGYAPGLRTDAAMLALSSAYCLLPCVLKAAALLTLWRWTSFFSAQETSP